MYLGFYAFLVKLLIPYMGKDSLGLNIHSFSAIEVFTDILSHCLAHKCSLFSTVKERRLCLQKNFHGTPKIVKNMKV